MKFTSIALLASCGIITVVNSSSIRRDLCVVTGNPVTYFEPDPNICQSLPAGEYTLTSLGSVIPGAPGPGGAGGPVGGGSSIYIFDNNCNEICYIGVPNGECDGPGPFQLQCGPVSMTVGNLYLDSGNFNINFVYGSTTYTESDCSCQTEGAPAADRYCRCPFGAPAPPPPPPVTPTCTIVFNDFSCGTQDTGDVETVVIRDGSCQGIAAPVTALNVDSGCVGANSINVYANPDCTGQSTSYPLDAVCHNPGFFFSSVQLS